MTKEEYEQCKVDQHSDDIAKAIQARFILSMFPTEETKYAVNSREEMDNFISKNEKTLSSILGEYK